MDGVCKQQCEKHRIPPNVQNILVCLEDCGRHTRTDASVSQIGLRIVGKPSIRAFSRRSDDSVKCLVIDNGFAAILAGEKAVGTPQLRCLEMHQSGRPSTIEPIRFTAFAGSELNAMAPLAAC